MKSDSFREKGAKEDIWAKAEETNVENNCILRYFCLRASGMHGKKIYSYRVWIRKPEGKRILGRPRLRWEGIKVDIIIVLIVRM